MQETITDYQRLKTAAEKLIRCQTFTHVDIFLLLIYQLQYSLLAHAALRERQGNLHVEGGFFMPSMPLFTQKLLLQLLTENLTKNTLNVA